MENHTEHPFKSVALVNTQQSGATVSQIVQYSSSASLHERQWQRTEPRDLDTAYEEYIEMRLKHYLETENLEIHQLEDEYNERVNRIEYIEQMEEEELQQINDEQLQEREQVGQQQ